MERWNMSVFQPVHVSELKTVQVLENKHLRVEMREQDQFLKFPNI